MLKKIGGISIDGTKIKANASKHAAVSYKRAGEMIEQLELEIEALIKKSGASRQRAVGRQVDPAGRDQAT